MIKFSISFSLFLLISASVSAQDYLTLDEIKDIYNAPINKKESKIVNHGFTLGTFQPTPGQKMYNKGLVYGSYYKEGISFVTKKTEYNDPVGVVSYQTWIPTHYASLSESVANKYKHLGNFEFDDSEGITYDLYEGNGFVIVVYSFVSSGGKMVGNVIFRPA